MSEPILLVRTNARGLLTLTRYGSKDNASMPFLTELEDFLLLFLEVLDCLMFYGYFAKYILTIFIRKQEKKRNGGLQMKVER